MNAMTHSFTVEHDAPLQLISSEPAPTWADVRARYEAAKAASDHYDATTWKPAWDAYEASKKPDPDRTIHWMDEDGIARSHAWKDNALEMFAKVPTVNIDAPTSEIGHAARALLAEITAVRDHNNVLREGFNIPAIDAEAERLDEIRYDLRNLLMVTPAPDIAALAFKIDLAVEHDMLGSDFDSGLPQASVQSDAARLARHAAN